MSVLNDILCIYRRKIIPYYKGIHFELYHIINVSDVVIYNMTPCPKSSVFYRRIRRTLKFGQNIIFQKIHPIYTLVMRIHIRYNIFIIKINTAVKHAFIVTTLNNCIIIPNFYAVFLLVYQILFRHFFYIRIVFLCADINTSEMCQIKLAVFNTNRIFARIVK